MAKVTVVERFKQESMYGLSAKKVAVTGARFDFTFPLDSGG